MSARAASGSAVLVDLVRHVGDRRIREDHVEWEFDVELRA